MSTYIGPLGGMVNVGCLSELSVDAQQKIVERTDINGGPSEQRFGRPWRTWSCAVGVLRPEQIGRLRVLQASQDASWWFVPCDAATGNVLPPSAVDFTGWVVTGTGRNLYTGGIVDLADGGLAVRSALPDYTGTDWAYSSPLFPLNPDGGPFTASIYARAGVGLTAAMRVKYYDGAGNPILTGPVSASATTTTSSGPLERLVVTETPSGLAAGAHAGRIQFRGAAVVANPAVTFTDTVQDWTDGRGAEHVSLRAPGERLLSTVPDHQLTSATFTVRELAR